MSNHWVLATAVVDAINVPTGPVALFALALFTAFAVTEAAHLIPRGGIAALKLQDELLVFRTVHEVRPVEDLLPCIRCTTQVAQAIVVFQHHLEHFVNTEAILATGVARAIVEVDRFGHYTSELENLRFCGV
tara:strand:- start:1292 stop:1687 length:396 start_codon:yes stop_codon:yes gene_type:complete